MDSQGGSWEYAKKIISNDAKEVLSAFLYSIEAEVGFGVGFSKSFKAGTNELSIGAYVNGYTFGLDDGDTFTANKGKFGGDISFGGGIVSIGVSSAYEHRYETGYVRVNDGHTAFTPPWELYGCEETEISDTRGIKLAGMIESNGPSDLTISFGGGTHFIIGYDYSVSINISEFFELLSE